MKTTLSFAALAALLIGVSSCGSSAPSGPVEKVLPPKVLTEVIKKYKEVETFKEGVCLVNNGYDKNGAIDAKGREIIPPQVYDLNEASGGMLVAGNRDYLYGAYNVKGEQVIPFKYKDLDDFHEGLAGFEVKTDKGDLYGYVNTRGKEVIAAQFSAVKEFSEGLASAAIEQGWYDVYGYINTKGEWVITPGYNEAESFSEGLAVVRKGEKYYVINKKEEVQFTLPEDLTPAGHFHEGMLLVCNDDMNFGFVNKKGQIALPCQYGFADGFRDGKALTLKVDGGKPTICFIDKKGAVKEVVQSLSNIEGYKNVETGLDSIFDILESLSELSSLSKSFGDLFSDDADEEDDDEDYE